MRWFPAAEELRSTAYEKLLPPLVAKLEQSSSWCWCNCLVQIDENGYGASEHGNKRGNSAIL